MVIAYYGASLPNRVQTVLDGNLMKKSQTQLKMKDLSWIPYALVVTSLNVQFVGFLCWAFGARGEDSGEQRLAATFFFVSILLMDVAFFIVPKLSPNVSN